MTKKPFLRPEKTEEEKACIFMLIYFVLYMAVSKITFHCNIINIM